MAIGLSDFSDFEIRKSRENEKLLGRGIAIMLSRPSGAQ